MSIEVRAGEIVGLIGTNGAGKTTLMNAIGGFVPVHREGRAARRVDLGHSPRPAAPARAWAAPSRRPRCSPSSPCARRSRSRSRPGTAPACSRPPCSRRGAVRRERAKRAEAVELIDFLGLGRYADKPISDLSTGTRRIVELAGLLALDARVLCLDEPTAGVAQRETEAFGPLLVEIRRQLGASMLIIEHDMPLIMSMSDRVYCLELGRVIAEGDPTEVRNDAAVIASYLGTDERTIARSGTAAT